MHLYTFYKKLVWGVGLPPSTLGTQTFNTSKIDSLVQDNPKLLDGRRGIPKSQGKGWWFESWL